MNFSEQVADQSVSLVTIPRQSLSSMKYIMSLKIALCLQRVLSIVASVKLDYKTKLIKRGFVERARGFRKRIMIAGGQLSSVKVYHATDRCSSLRQGILDVKAQFCHHQLLK